MSAAFLDEFDELCDPQPMLSPLLSYVSWNSDILMPSLTCSLCLNRAPDFSCPSHIERNKAAEKETYSFPNSLVITVVSRANALGG